MHIWLVELKFAKYFLFNTVYMMYFARMLTILLHFLERVLDRPNFSIITYIHFVTMAQRKSLYPSLIFYFEENVKSFPKRFSD
jgi:hypothetical protein